MQASYFPIIAAGVVMLLVLAIWQIVAHLTDPEKRKLLQRLSGSGEGASRASAAQQSITLLQESDGLSSVLSQFSLFGRLEKMLIYAAPEMSLSTFTLIALGSGLGAAVVTFAVSASALVAAVAGALGIYTPCIWLSTKRARRQRQLVDQLPEALDFLSRILKAGHSLSTGLQMMAEELPQPIAGEFRRAYDQHSLGQSLEEALRDTSRRIDSTDFAFFVTAVLIQRQTGGDLSEVLGNISGMIRQRIRLQQHVKAKTAEGRFTGYILSAFPAVMFVIAYSLNPAYTGVLIRTDTGLIMLAVALGLQCLGLYFIKKLTTVTV
jgi:tight adherence protein B